LSQWFKSFVIETPLPYVCFLPRVFTLKNYPDFYCEFYCPKLPVVFTPVFTLRITLFFYLTHFRDGLPSPPVGIRLERCRLHNLLSALKFAGSSACSGCVLTG